MVTVQSKTTNSKSVAHLTKLFDTEFQFDYINGTAEITNKKT